MVDNLCGAFALAHLKLRGKSSSGTARRVVYLSVSKSLFWKEECCAGISTCILSNENGPN